MDVGGNTGEGRISTLQRLTIACAAVVFLAACQTTALKSVKDFSRPEAGTRVLLMTPDVQLAELLAAGLMKPRADWTADAKRHINLELDRFLGERAFKLVRYAEPAAVEKLQMHDRLINLHGAVGNAVIVHNSIPALKLPTKQDKFDWTLGPNASRLREDFNADLALFVYVRDSYASAGRAAMIFAGLLFGVAIPAGQQQGFASLVDLRTGDIVWFNRVFGTTGDLRKPESAGVVVEGLLNEIPL